MPARKVSETEELLRLLAMLDQQRAAAEVTEKTARTLAIYRAGLYVGLDLAHGELKAICNRRLKKKGKPDAKIKTQSGPAQGPGAPVRPD